jgi:ribosomal protein L11 methyltransferase
VDYLFYIYGMDTNLKFVEITFQVEQSEMIDIAIALLDDYPFSGYVELDEAHFRASLEHTYWNKTLKAEVQTTLEGIATLISEEERPFENWNALWESNFDPIFLGDWGCIKAPFHTLEEDRDMVMIIHPRMAFGTGHHATTQMMLEMMRNLSWEGKDVLDFGCGTGVLAIFAAMQGADRVHGIDIESWSVENSRENAILNGVDSATFSEETLLDLIQQDKKYPFILANIQLDVLTAYGEQIKALLPKDGQVLLSGVMLDFKDQLEHTYRSLGFELMEHMSKDKWICQRWKL